MLDFNILNTFEEMTLFEPVQDKNDSYKIEKRGKYNGIKGMDD